MTGECMQIKRILREMSHILPDKWSICLEYYRFFGRFPDLKNPKTFNEKLQWLKLYDRNPEYTRMVDKYEAKRYAASIIGDEHIVPSYGVWDAFEDIDFDALPNQFVLKCTHDCGGLVICKDKTKLDLHAARGKIKQALKRNYYWQDREWPYKNVKPRIIAEKYMEDSLSHDLPDYKFFCFHGKVKALFIATDRNHTGEETKFDFFDSNFNHLNVRNGHPNAVITPQKPKNFEKMKQLAEKLSEGIAHVRVDFYEVDGRPYFGELTFFHWSGMVPFDPEEWDLIFGSWLNLPTEK